MDGAQIEQLRDWCDREASSDEAAARLFRAMKRKLDKLPPEKVAIYCRGTWRTSAVELLGGDWHLLAR